MSARARARTRFSLVSGECEGVGKFAAPLLNTECNTVIVCEGERVRG